MARGISHTALDMTGVFYFQRHIKNRLTALWRTKQPAKFDFLIHALAMLSPKDGLLSKGDWEVVIKNQSPTPLMSTEIDSCWTFVNGFTNLSFRQNLRQKMERGQKGMGRSQIIFNFSKRPIFSPFSTEDLKKHAVEEWDKKTQEDSNQQDEAEKARCAANFKRALPDIKETLNTQQTAIATIKRDSFLSSSDKEEIAMLMIPIIEEVFGAKNTLMTRSGYTYQFHKRAIDAQCKKMLAKLHPDKNKQDPKATETFKMFGVFQGILNDVVD